MVVLFGFPSMYSCRKRTSSRAVNDAAIMRDYKRRRGRARSRRNPNSLCTVSAAHQSATAAQEDEGQEDVVDIFRNLQNELFEPQNQFLHAVRKSLLAEFPVVVKELGLPIFQDTASDDEGL